MNNIKKDKFNLVKLKYMFIKINKEIDFWKIRLDEDIKSKYQYLLPIIYSIDSKNRISFDEINLSESNLRTLLSLFKKKWFIGQLKLKWDSKKTYYLNPYYAHTWKTISKELYEAFNDINNNKVY